MGEGNLDAAKLPSVCIIYYIFIMSNIYSWEEIEMNFPNKFVSLLEVKYENLDNEDYDPADTWETLYLVEDVSEKYIEGFKYIEGEDIFNF